MVEGASGAVSPIMMLQVLHMYYPQFAEKSEHGGFQQQVSNPSQRKLVSQLLMPGCNRGSFYWACQKRKAAVIFSFPTSTWAHVVVAFIPESMDTFPWKKHGRCRFSPRSEGLPLRSRLNICSSRIPNLAGEYFRIARILDDLISLISAS